MATVVAVGLVGTDMVFKKDGKKVFMVEVTKENFFGKTKTKLVMENDEDGTLMPLFFTKKKAHKYMEQFGYGEKRNAFDDKHSKL
jgi:hypothetical protein